jgi:hypothetical protein
MLAPLVTRAPLTTYDPAFRASPDLKRKCYYQSHHMYKYSCYFNFNHTISSSASSSFLSTLIYKYNLNILSLIYFMIIYITHII